MVWGTLIGSGYTLILIAEQLKLTRTMQLHQRMLSIAFAILGLSYLLAGALIYIGMECVSHFIYEYLVVGSLYFKKSWQLNLKLILYCHDLKKMTSIYFSSIFHTLYTF